MPRRKKRNGRPPSHIERLGKRKLTTYLRPAFHEALRRLADEQECSLQYLSETALLALLHRHGRTVVEPAASELPAAAVAAE